MYTMFFFYFFPLHIYGGEGTGHDPTKMSKASRGLDGFLKELQCWLSKINNFFWPFCVKLKQNKESHPSTPPWSRNLLKTPHIGLDWAAVSICVSNFAKKVILLQSFLFCFLFFFVCFLCIPIFLSLSLSKRMTAHIPTLSSSHFFPQNLTLQIH